MSQSPPPLWPKSSTTVQSQSSPPSDHQAEPPTPERSQAQFYMTQTLDLSAKVLKSYWEIHDWTHSRLADEFKKLQQQSEEFKKREQAVTSQLEEAEKKLKDSESTLEAAMKEKDEASKKEAEAERLSAENKKTELRIKPLLEKEKEILENKEAAAEALQNAQNERKAAETAMANAAADHQQARTIKDQILALQSQSWPPSLSGDRWLKWRTTLQENAKQEPNAALVIAAFHRFCAAEKAADPQELCDALHHLGRRLYAEISEPEFVAQIGTAFNEAAGGKFQLKFARQGDPTSDQWMNYQPGLGSVRQVRNWAVFKLGAAGGLQIASKAEVQ